MRRSHKELVLLVWQGERTTSPMQSYAVIHIKQKVQSAVGQLRLGSWPLRNCHRLPSFRCVRSRPPNHRSSKLLWFPSANEPHEHSVDCEAYIQSSFQRKLAPTNLFWKYKRCLARAVPTHAIMPTYLRSYMCWHWITPMYSHKSQHRFRHLFRNIDININIYVYLYIYIYLFVYLFIQYCWYQKMRNIKWKIFIDIDINIYIYMYIILTNNIHKYTTGF